MIVFRIVIRRINGKVVYIILLFIKPKKCTQLSEKVKGVQNFKFEPTDPLVGGKK